MLEIRSHVDSPLQQTPVLGTSRPFLLLCSACGDAVWPADPCKGAGEVENSITMPLFIFLPAWDFGRARAPRRPPPAAACELVFVPPSAPPDTTLTPPLPFP